MIDRHPRLLWTAIVASPLIVAAVVLLWKPWAPTLDMAMTELRVRDVGTGETPLIGLPGRIGNFPDQGSHPGPWSFYLVAPFYWLSGRRAWGLEFASAMLNGVALGVVVWLGHRLRGTHGALLAAAVAAVAVRGYGLSVLTHPWNPYFPVLLWLVVLFATWLVVAGDHAVVPVVIVAASLSAQTHIPYLLNGIAMCALAFGAALWHRHRLADDERRRATRSLLIALGVGAFIWLPPFVDELIHDPGNITMIVEHFTGEPTEEPIALAEAARVFFRHLDVPALVPDLVTQSDAFVHRSGLPGGLGLGGIVVFAGWLLAAWWSWRRRHSILLSLNLVISVALVVQIVSISRIFGKVWYYLTLWAWSTTLLIVVSIAWSVTCVVGERLAQPVASTRSRVGVALAVLAGGATALSLLALFRLEVPDPQLSGPLYDAIDDTTTAIDDAVGAAIGPDGTYVVFWQDALFIGAQGYGLVNELERRGYDVGVHPTWRVPVTHHRVVTPGSYDAEVHLVTGQFIDEWRDRPDFVEVALVDERSTAEAERFEELRAGVIARLVELGREDLVEVVDFNLFGASLDPDLPQDVIDDMSEMIEIGLPMAVFIAPPGNSF